MLRKSRIENISLKNATVALKQELKPKAQAIIGQSLPMKAVMDIVQKVAGNRSQYFYHRRKWDRKRINCPGNS